MSEKPIEYTEWKAVMLPSDNQWGVYALKNGTVDYCVAKLTRLETAEANADLICALHNMAISINPEHPEVVAEGMEELVEGCETYCRTQNPDRMLQALFKITGGK